MEVDDVDNIKDDQSPVQQNIEIHRQRLFNVMDRTVQKFEIAYCLDEFTENDGFLIAPYLSESDLKTVLETYARNFTYEGSLSKTSRSSKSIDRVRSGKSVMMAFEKREDMMNSNVIGILHHNTAIRKLAHEILKKKDIKNVEFLLLVSQLREMAIKRLYTTATQDRIRKKTVGQLWKKNQKYMAKNTELINLRDKKLNELSTKLNEKNTLIDNQVFKLAQMRINCIEDLQLIINNSERQMDKTTLSSEERQEILAEEARAITNQYQTLLESNLAHEKAMRVKRYKVETVLANWLAKYDQDIGELQSELEELTEGYNNEKAEFDDLQRKFNEQEIQYVELMTEKEQEERRVYEKKCYEFILNRSARRIQRWWRAILARRKSRKKGKKGKGKKK